MLVHRYGEVVLYYLIERRSKMDFFSLELWIPLLSIVVIDVVLAGDNALVIGLAARNLPKHEQRKVIIYGTIGALVIRILATIGITWILHIPFLFIIGGIILMWIAIKLGGDKKQYHIKAKADFWSTVRTIIVADAAMGLDNVLAVAGVAEGRMWLVIIGLIISLPIIIWGSTVILKVIKRYPFILIIGSTVLAWTGAKMFIGQVMKLTGIPLFSPAPIFIYSLEIGLVSIVLLLGYVAKRHHQKTS